MSFWDRLFGHQEAENRSKDVAKQRLQVVLVHDRTRIRPGLLDTIRDEIVSGISKHVEVDKGHVELSLASEGGQSRLVADIPLKVAGRPRQRPTAG
ncbi:MAG: Cell division topological specificity factor [Anaerolineales bacterium]|nr:Cell division topological specificity factor [Anaerolineales bacterium]